LGVPSVARVAGFACAPSPKRSLLRRRLREGAVGAAPEASGEGLV